MGGADFSECIVDVCELDATATRKLNIDTFLSQQTSDEIFHGIEMKI